MVIIPPATSTSFNSPSAEAVARTPTFAELIAEATSATLSSALMSTFCPLILKSPEAASLSKSRSKNNVVDADAVTPV